MTPVIEAVRQEDAHELDALMARCSAETRYRRFFAPLRTMPAEYRTGALAGDPTRHDAVVTHLPIDAGPAGSGGGGRIVALASLVTGPEGPGVAELGVLVEDGWQRRGLGTALVAELICRARGRGVPYLRATVQPRATGLLVWLGRIVPLDGVQFAGDAVTARYRLL
jgi:GNAT superfamily N-acetyltransferase